VVSEGAGTTDGAATRNGGTGATARLAVALLVALTFVAVQLAMAQPGSASTGVPCPQTGNEIVATDQAAYAPGDLVHVSGMGYAADCDVTVKVTRPDGSVVTGDGSSTPGSDSVTTDLFGGLSYDYQLQSSPAVQGTYVVDVLGSADVVLARTTFLDAPKINFSAAPSPVLASTGRVIALEVTNTNGSTFPTSDTDNIRCVKVTFPVGFTPLSVVGTATTRAGQTWTASVSGQVVTALASNATSDQVYRQESVLLQVATTTPAAGNSSITAVGWNDTGCSVASDSKNASVSVEGADANSYTAAATPGSTPWNASRTYTVSLTNTSSPANPASKAKVYVPIGFTVDTGQPITATPSGNAVCGKANGAWLPDGTLLSDGRLNFKSAGNSTDLCSGATLNVTFTATSPVSGSGPYTWVTELTTGQGFLLTGTQPTVTIDNTPPTVTINQASGQNDPTNASPINFTVVFSESVTGFTGSDVTLSGTAGATTATVTGSGTTYNVAVSGMTSNGTVIVTVPAGSNSPSTSGAQDAAGNGNSASTSSDNTVTYDTTKPSVTINQAGTQNDPTNASPINFTVVFSESVTGFTGSDVTLSGTAGATTATVTGSGTTYNVAVSGMSSRGTVVASIPVGADSPSTTGAQDAAGNGNVASTSTDNMVTWDRVPTASAQSVTTAEDTPKVVTLSSSDPDNDNQSFSIVSGPSNGTLGSVGPVSCTGTGPRNCSADITYTPAADYNGADSFTFKTNDGLFDSNTATVSVTVTEVNDAPSAGDDTRGPVAEDGSLTFSAAGLTGNDSAGPGNESSQTLTVTAVSATPDTHGTVSLVAGDITYTPAADYNGPASFDYTVRDNGTTNGTDDFKSDTGSVSVTVTEVNDAPSAGDDTRGPVAEDGSLTFSAAGLTGNDSAGPGNESSQTLTVTAVSATPDTHGTVSLVAGDITYTPAADYNGPASFDYTVRDNGTTNGTDDFKSDTGSVSVTVDPVNDQPSALATPDSLSVNEGGSDTTTLSGSDVETGAGDLTFTITHAPAHGTLVHAATTPGDGDTFTGSPQDVTYTASSNYHGADNFKFTVTDTGDPAGCSAAPCDDPVTSSEVTVPITVNDVTAPSISLDQPADGTNTHDATPTFSGAAGTHFGDSATVYVDIYAGGTASGTPVQTLSTPRDSGTGSYAVDSATLADGTYTAKARQSDDSTHRGYSSANTFVVDTVKPTSKATSPAITNQTMFSVGYTDLGDASPSSGFDKVEIYVKTPGSSTYDPTPAHTFTSPAASDSFTYTADGDGTYDFYSIAYDNAGNVEAVPLGPDNVTIVADSSTLLDTAPPSSSIQCNSAPCASSYYSADVTVELDGNDNLGGSGLKEIRYTTDGSTPTASHGTAVNSGDTFTVSSTTTVKFVAVDNAGNVETPVNSQTINIDKANPTSSILCNGVACSASYYNADVTVTLNGSDTGGSGLKEIRYTTDGSTPTASHGTAVNSGDTFTVSSTTTVKFVAVDNAGNVETPVNSQTINIDKVPPAVQSIDRADASPTNAASVSWTVTFSKNVSGIDSGDFQLANSGLGGSSSITSVVQGVNAATYTVTASTGTGNGTLGLNLVDNDSITDSAGNKLGGTGTSGAGDGSFTGQVYTIDKTAPTVTVTAPPSPQTASTVHFTATVSETTVDTIGNGDITVGGTAGATTGTVTGTGPTYDIAVSGMTMTGTITVKVDANAVSDAAGNPNAESNTASVQWNQTVSTNSAPVVTITSPAPYSLYAKPANVSLSASFTDPDAGQTHTCSISWDDGSTTTPAVSPDSTPTTPGTCAQSHTYNSAGVYTIVVTVCDNFSPQGCDSDEVMIVVYDASAGFITGGGWINVDPGSYPANPTLTGRANFGFNSQYKKGSTVPTGETEFQFQVGNLNFHSTAYSWLVVSGYKAQYKGTGTVNGISGYDFTLTAYDGAIAGAGQSGYDRFRIKITKNGVTVFDNRNGASMDMDAANPQNIGGGSIVIHKA
jgi:large repetitive protein